MACLLATEKAIELFYLRVSWLSKYVRGIFSEEAIQVFIYSRIFDIRIECSSLHTRWRIDFKVGVITLDKNRVHDRKYDGHLERPFWRNE